MTPGRAAGLRGYRILLAVGLTALAATGLLTVLLNHPFRGYGGERKLLEVPEGASASRIVSLLREEGVIRYALPVRIYLALTLGAGRIRAGEYLFDEPASAASVVGRLLRGDVFQRQVTVPEGAWLGDVVEAVVKAGITEEEPLREALGDPEPIRDLVPGALSWEGYLFPDTYRFPKGTPPKEILTAMVHRFREVMERIAREDCVEGEIDVPKVVTLASLIEKETGQDEERARISAVFHNRLRRRMPLQCDPTVIYALLQEDRFSGRLTRADLNIPSPYNTYLHQGLPPGPIANPGEKSIRAAACPEETDYIYFVSMNTGRHYFSRDLSEHQEAVRRFQR